MHCRVIVTKSRLKQLAITACAAYTSFPPRIMIAATGFLIITIGYFYIIVYFGARKRNINEISPADFVYVAFA